MEIIGFVIFCPSFISNLCGNSHFVSLVISSNCCSYNNKQKHKISQCKG